MRRKHFYANVRKNLMLRCTTLRPTTSRETFATAAADIAALAALYEFDFGGLRLDLLGGVSLRGRYLRDLSPDDERKGVVQKWVVPHNADTDALLELLDEERVRKMLKRVLKGLHLYYFGQAQHGRLLSDASDSYEEFTWLLLGVPRRAGDEPKCE